MGLKYINKRTEGHQNRTKPPALVPWAKSEFLPVRRVWLNWTQKRGRSAPNLIWSSEGSQRHLVVNGDRGWNGGLLQNFLFHLSKKNWVQGPSITTDTSSWCSDLWESGLKTPCGLLVNFFASYSPSHDHIVVEILIVFHGPLVFVSFLHSLCFCDFLKCGVDSVKPSLLLSLTTGCLKHTHSVSARPWS